MSLDRDIVEFSTLDSKCAYLGDRLMRLRYNYIFNATFELNSKYVEYGWRRFGKYYSKPICHECDKCKSIRVHAPSFVFGKSAKRAIKKNKHTKIILKNPSVTFQHVNLYNKYHKFMQEKKDWDFNPMTFQRYHDLYVDGHGDFGKEVLYFIDNKLVGVDLIDIVTNGISSIYFFYDPDFSKYSLGRYSLYQQILIAKEYNLEWIYLGYNVKECSSLNYKEYYKPYQTLQKYVEFDKPAVWQFEDGGF